MELALGGGTAGAHTGERARSNVRHSLRAVRAQLKKGGREANAFAEHLRTQVTTGYECLYLQPQGAIWD